MKVILQSVLCLWSGCGFAQPVPTLTFTLDFPRSDPEHYVIQVQSDGKASYDSRTRIASAAAATSANDAADAPAEAPAAGSKDAQASDLFHLDFMLSAPTATRVFELAAKARYFQSPLETRHKGLAAMGQKTLAYQDAQRTGQATYNYSEQLPVQELTQIFQNLAATLDFARRLDYDHRYQKLALDQDLKRMEQMAKSHSLLELQAAAPILQQIVADPSVINVVRSRAQALLKPAQSK